MNRMGKWLMVACSAAFTFLAQGATELMDRVVDARVAKLNEEGVAGAWSDSVPGRPVDRFVYRITFVTDESKDDFLSLTLQQPDNISDIRLNGERVPYPVERMEYIKVAGIPSDMLKTGTNVLEATTFVSWKARKNWKRKPSDPRPYPARDIKFALKGMVASDLVLQSGPVLGYAGTDMASVACRVNVPAEVRLKLGGQTLKSPLGLIHDFKVESLKPDTKYPYVIEARVRGGAWTTLSDQYAVRTYPKGDQLEFLAMGDSRSTPDRWNKVSVAAAAEKPMFCVFTGDWVTHGRKNYLWDREFFHPGRDFLATVPFYARNVFMPQKTVMDGLNVLAVHPLKAGTLR